MIMKSVMSNDNGNDINMVMTMKIMTRMTMTNDDNNEKWRNEMK